MTDGLPRAPAVLCGSKKCAHIESEEPETFDYNHTFLASSIGLLIEA